MKKISLLLVSFLIGHSLTPLDRYIVKKSIDNDDNHFQSLCPSLRSSVNYSATNTKNNQKSLGIVKIDRDDHTITNDSLLNVQSDCTESIDRFRNFATNFTETL
jgi:hypothetical protein